MIFNNLYNILFSYINYEKKNFKQTITNPDYKGVLIVIPSIAITAYILDLDYENIKDFYYRHIKWCEKYEAYFKQDYERYLNILEIIKNSDIISTLSNKFCEATFSLNVSKPIPYDKFVNLNISNIIKYKDIYIDNEKLNNKITYNIDFIYGKNVDEKQEKEISKILKEKFKILNKKISGIDVLISDENKICCNIYMKLSFDINDFIKLIDKLKNTYQNNLKHSF